MLRYFRSLANENVDFLKSQCMSKSAFPELQFYVFEEMRKGRYTTRYSKMSIDIAGGSFDPKKGNSSIVAKNQSVLTD